MEQWYDHLIKAGYCPPEIGTYNGDRTRKHGVLRGTGDEAGGGPHLHPPRVTLLTMHTLGGDVREMMKTFHEDEHKVKHCMHSYSLVSRTQRRRGNPLRPNHP